MNDQGISLAANDLTSVSTGTDFSADPLHLGSLPAVAPRHVATAARAQPAERPQTIGYAAQSPTEPVLRVRGLKKSYRRGVHEIPVLGGVDLEIASGEFLSIVGQSGCGKSTLLHLLGTLDKPDEGEIYFEGHRIDNLDAAGCDVLRNKHFGMIFQFYHLLPEFNTLQNVLTPLLISNGLISYLRHRRQYRRRAMELLEMVGLSHRLRHKPRELSGGEMQRAAIARALIANPRVLLADEPTGNLDKTTGDEIIRILRRLNQDQNLTIVMVTHDAAIADSADRQVCLVEGHVVGR